MIIQKSRQTHSISVSDSCVFSAYCNSPLCRFFLKKIESQFFTKWILSSKLETDMRGLTEALEVDRKPSLKMDMHFLLGSSFFSYYKIVFLYSATKMETWKMSTKTLSALCPPVIKEQLRTCMFYNFRCGLKDIESFERMKKA